VHEVLSLLKQLDPFFFGFGDERDLLLKRARQGELSPGEAEEEAVAQGLGRLTRTPDPNAAPRTRVAWTLGMALAWIIWRDLDPVRDHWPEYLAEFAEWHLLTAADQPEKASWHLKPREAPDYLDFRRTTLDEAQKRFPVHLSPASAVEELDFQLGIGGLPEARGAVRSADVLTIWATTVTKTRKATYKTAPQQLAMKYLEQAFPSGLPKDMAPAEIIRAVHAAISPDVPEDQRPKRETILRAAGHRKK
jgi:hypothetical protein